MKSRTIAICIFCGPVLLAVVHAAYYYPLLPDKMASHFGPGGQADDWMDKPTFMCIYAMLACVVGVVLFSPSLFLHKTPVRMLNLPNKDYWLAPERRTAAFRWLSISMLWFGNATLALMIGCMEITFRTNLRPGWNPSTAFGMTLGIYLAAVLVWLGVLLYRFRLPKETSRE